MGPVDRAEGIHMNRHVRIFLILLNGFMFFLALQSCAPARGGLKTHPDWDNRLDHLNESMNKLDTDGRE